VLILLFGVVVGTHIEKKISRSYKDIKAQSAGATQLRRSGQRLLTRDVGMDEHENLLFEFWSEICFCVCVCLREVIITFVCFLSGTNVGC
jgi:hypothetical protein